MNKPPSSSLNLRILKTMILNSVSKTRDTFSEEEEKSKPKVGGISITRWRLGQTHPFILPHLVMMWEMLLIWDLVAAVYAGDVVDSDSDNSDDVDVESEDWGRWPLFYFLIWLYFLTDSIRLVNFADLPSWSPNLLKPTMMLPADMVRSPCFQMTRFSPRASTSQESKTSRSWKKRISVLASYQRFKQFL